MVIRALPSRQYGPGYPGDLDGWAADVDAALRGGGGASLPTGTLLDVAAGNGDGATSTQTVPAGAFTTIVMPTKTVDTAGGYNTSTGQYTVPATGTYLILAKVRPQDNAGAGQGVGIGVHTSNADNPNFVWGIPVAPSSGTTRTVFGYQRLAQFNSGDVLRLFCYVANGSSLVLSAASMQIIRLA